MLHTTKINLRFCGQCFLMSVSVTLFVYMLLHHRPVSGPQKGQQTLAEKIQSNVVGNEVTNQGDKNANTQPVVVPNYQQGTKDSVTASGEDTSR